MKISIQLEVHPDEVPLVTELLSALRLLTDHAKAPPPVVVNTRELLEGLIGRMDGEQAAQAQTELLTVLQDETYGPVDKLSEELVEACIAVALNMENAMKSGVATYLAFLPRLPEPHKAKVRDKLIAKVLSHVAKKRGVDAPRTDFFAHSEAFAVLVKFEYVGIDGAVQTIERLLNKVDTRAAALTMLGKTVELCHPQLQKASEQHLGKLRAALAGVQEAVFQYDVDYIASSMGWQAPSSAAPEQASAAPPAAIAAQPADNRPPSAAATSTTASAAPRTAPSPGPPEPTAPAGAPAAAPAITQLHALTSLPPLAKTVFALAYNPITHELAAAGRDDTIAVYSSTLELIHSPVVPYSNMVVSMDLHPRHNLLAMCGVTMDDSSGANLPCIALFDASQQYAERAVSGKPSGTIMTCIRSFAADSDCLVAAESISSGGPKNAELLCVYDLSRISSQQPLQPFTTFDQHADLVTCVSTSTSHPQLFASGSRDCTVRLWDLRNQSAVGLFSAPGSGGYAHSQMVTSLDVVDNVVVSAGQDAALCIWDIRMMGGAGADGGPGPMCAMQVDTSVLLRVAMRGAPAPNLVAVASVMGLNLVDFSNPAAPVRVQASLATAPNQPFSLYHDIKWAAGQPLLYAAGDGMQVDIFQAM